MNACTFLSSIMPMSLFLSVFLFNILIQVSFYVFLSSSLVIIMLFSSYHCYRGITCPSSVLKGGFGLYFNTVSTFWSLYHIHQYKLLKLNFFLSEIVISHRFKFVWHWFGFLLFYKFFRSWADSARKNKRY